MINECGAVDGIELARKTEAFGEIPPQYILLP
jgi:hypothetical protein